MFKGAQSALQKGTREYEPPLGPNIFEVHSVEYLLASEKHQQILKNIRSYVTLSASEYETYYLKTIYNFAEFVQLLPETKASYYSHNGGLLDHALERASLSLSLCRSFLLPPNSPSDYSTPEVELWFYAVFTAALLLDVGKIPTKLRVSICDRTGKEIKEWLPYAGSLKSQDSVYYQYSFERENRVRLQNMVTPLIARQLLGSNENLTQNKIKTHGFNWIASNKEVLESWLSMLLQESTGFGAILTVIPLAQAQTIAQYFAEMKRGHTFAHQKQAEGFMPGLPTDKHGQQKQQSTLFKSDPALTSPENISSETATPYQMPVVAGTGTHAAAHTNVITGSVAASVRPEVVMGHAFLQWLRNQLMGKSEFNITNSESKVRIVSDGLYIDQKVFQEFSKNSQYKEWKTVMAQFNALEISTPSTAKNSNGVVVNQLNLGLLLKEDALKLTLLKNIPEQLQNFSRFDFGKPTPK